MVTRFAAPSGKQQCRALSLLRKLRISNLYSRAFNHVRGPFEQKLHTQPGCNRLKPQPMDVPTRKWQSEVEKRRKRETRKAPRGRFGAQRAACTEDLKWEKGRPIPDPESIPGRRGDSSSQAGKRATVVSLQLVGVQSTPPPVLSPLAWFCSTPHLLVSCARWPASLRTTEPFGHRVNFHFLLLR